MTPRETSPHAPPIEASREAGFTLIEALVSLLVMVMVLTGLLALLEFNSRVARAQLSVADMQQALRVAQADMVRQVRMAGRGGLPVRRPPTAGGYTGMSLPAGTAVAVENNVADGTTIGGDPNAAVLEGTDIVTVRGVINTPLYQVSWDEADGDVKDARTNGNGRITVRQTSRSGVPQDLTALKEALRQNRPEALILVSPGNEEVHAVVQLTGGTDNGDHVSLNFLLSGTQEADAYRLLSPGGEFPPGLLTVAAVGILEEYRYYVHESVDPQIAPSLARARVYPGTDLPYAGAAENLHVDLADNILDLQAALGIDYNDDLAIVDNEDGTDDWLFNAPEDSPPLESRWNAPLGRRLYYVRINTLARTDRIDPNYVSPPIDAIEDHVYNEPTQPPDAAARLERSHRRRTLQTVVDLRNLS